MSEQTPLVAENFIAGLVQQCQTKMKGGIYHLTQVGYRQERGVLDGVSRLILSVLPILCGSRVLLRRLRGCRSGRGRSVRLSSSIFWG